MQPNMRYDGQAVHWPGVGTFKATSGFKWGPDDYQSPKYQCTPDAGPIPEGRYYFVLKEGGAAADDGRGNCRLVPARAIQTIPRGAQAGACETYWANWGNNRVALTPADAKTRHKCSPRRAGFYLHDSTKGYSHGCIEIEGRFFSVIRAKAAQPKHPPRLVIEIRYSYAVTNGGTGP